MDDTSYVCGMRCPKVSVSDTLPYADHYPPVRFARLTDGDLVLQAWNPAVREWQVVPVVDLTPVAG